MARFLYILLVVVLFGVLIAIHEFGHFITAKLLGVKVNEFAIGMGPALWSRRKGETLYALRAFPVGGYCAMEGEDEDTGDPRAFSRQKGWKKIVISPGASSTRGRTASWWATGSWRWTATAFGYMAT